MSRLRKELFEKESIYGEISKKDTTNKLELNSKEHSLKSTELEINNLENDIKHTKSILLDIDVKKKMNASTIESLNKQIKVLRLPENEQKELDEIENKIKSIDDEKLKLKENQEKLRIEENNNKIALMDIRIKKNNLENF